MFLGVIKQEDWPEMGYFLKLYDILDSIYKTFAKIIQAADMHWVATCCLGLNSKDHFY